MMHRARWEFLREISMGGLHPCPLTNGECVNAVIVANVK